MSFRRRVADLFPLTLRLTAVCFVVLFMDNLQEPDPLVGFLDVAFGALLVIGISLLPAQEKRP